MLSQEKIEQISYQVIKTLYKKFDDFPEDPSGIRNAPFHMAFLNAFRNKLEEHVTDIPVFISLSSWFHGLNTFLGQSFFEKVSHILCDGIKREFKELKISQSQQTAISDIIVDLKNSIHLPNLIRENEIIFRNNLPQDKVISNFTADCYFEESDKIVCIEIKTVKPNSGIFKNEKDKILTAKAALRNISNDKEIFFYLGFPFDPLSEEPTGSNKNNFLEYSVDFKKFFEPKEFMIADEFWNFLSGDTNTMNQLLSIINSIACIEFKEKYEFLNNPSNKSNREAYIQQLEEWNLFSEILLVSNEERLLEAIRGNSGLIRKFNQPMFKKEEYNIERLNALIQLL